MIWALAILGLLLGPTIDHLSYRVARRPVVHVGRGMPELLPIIGWVAGMRAKATRLASVRRAVIEASAATTLPLMWASTESWARPTFVVLGAGCIILMMADLHAHLLPNKVTYPMIVVAGTTLPLISVISGDPGRSLNVIYGALAWSVAILLIILAKPGSMGLGDAKLAVSLGGALAWLGLEHFVIGVWSSMILGLPYLIGVLLVKGKLDRSAHVAYGPLMIAGFVVGVTLGHLGESMLSV